MNAQRIFYPTVKTIGRFISWNKPDVFYHGVKAYNNHNAQSVPSNLQLSPLVQQNLDENLNYHQNILHRGRGSYLKIVSKSFSNDVQVFCREFSDGENEHAHDVMRSIPAYEATTVDTKETVSQYFINAFSFFTFRDKFWPSVGTDEIVATFMLVSKSFLHKQLSSEDEQYSKLCISVIERIPYMNDDQLLTVLSAMSYWDPSESNTSSSTSNFDMLCRALDEACCARLRSWNISKLFLVSDHWYALRILKNSVFFVKGFNILARNLNSLSSTQLVQYMFYANLYRDLGAVKRRRDLQLKLKEVLNSLSVEEVGIIAMALFKTRTNIADPEVIDVFIKTALKNIEIISNHSIGSILKLLHMCLPSDAHTQCYNVLDSLNNHIERFNNFVLLQIAIFGNNLLVFHEEVMHKIAVRFVQQISSLRLKDIERFAYSVMLYNFIPPDCPDMVNILINELRRPERIIEINHFPRSFTSCVNYLVCMGAFPHDLISAALQPSMVQLLKSTGSADGNMGREMNELNWAVKIELCPNYVGYLLDEFHGEELTKNYMGSIPSNSSATLSHQEKLLLDMKSKLSAVMGIEKCVEPALILPHFFNPDLVFCTTDDGLPVELPSEFRRLPLYSLKTVKEMQHLGLLWNAVIVGGRNSYIRNTKELKGGVELKRRQLAKLGYRVSVVPYTDYVKRNIKYKLQCLERSLLGTSSLNWEGRKELAMDILKSDSPSQQSVKEMVAA